MMEGKFNLVDESWIRALENGEGNTELSLRDFFLRADKILVLGGETDLQNTALLRLFIAINVTILYRYGIDGKERYLRNPEEALERFRSVWERGSFSNLMINAYFDRWHDRFFLLGGERPFFQVHSCYRKETEDGKNKKNPTGITFIVQPYGDSDKLSWINAGAFNGTVLEAANSPSPFAAKFGNRKDEMRFSEAARWLIHYMAYADCSAKNPGKWNAGMPFASGGANIHPVGANLFETIMLCSAMLTDKGLYDKVCPSWERDDYTEINASPYGNSFPRNLPELYTQQSRKVVLHEKEKDGVIDGAYVAAGDRFSTTSSFSVEPMFAFHEDKRNKNGMTFIPNHITENGAGWKEFQNIFGGDKDYPARWIEFLFNKDILPDDMNVPFAVTDISYGSMQCGVDETYSSGITVNKKFLCDRGEIENAKDAIDTINQISDILGKFGKNVDCSQGAPTDSRGKGQSSLSDQIKTAYENKIGAVFCLYLVNKKSLDELKKSEIRYADESKDELLRNINISAAVVHGDMSLGKAENIFQKNMSDVKKNMGIINLR